MFDQDVAAMQHQCGITIARRLFAGIVVDFYLVERTITV
jgi:hypothetical protein